MLGRNLTHPATEESLPVLPYETARCPGMAVLLGSGYADDRAQWRVIRQKGYCFLQKPYTLVDLLKAIHGALEGSA